MNLSSLSPLAQQILAPFGPIALPSAVDFIFNGATTDALRQTIINAIAAAQSDRKIALIVRFPDTDGPIELDAEYVGSAWSVLPGSCVTFATCSRDDDPAAVLDDAIYGIHLETSSQAVFEMEQERWDNRTH